jgi:hypothetical protein
MRIDEEPRERPRMRHEIAGTLRREGELWSIAYGGALVRIKSSKGVYYLAYLLERPHTEVHVLELTSQTSSAPPRPSSIPPSLRVGDLGDAGPILDERTKESYRTRLIALRDDLEEALGFGDLGRSEKARSEIEALTDQLAAAVGLGGRSRRAAAQAERARVNVTRTIKAALDRIRKSHAELGKHFAEHVRTGTYCSYSPGVAVAEWSVKR